VKARIASTQTGGNLGSGVRAPTLSGPGILEFAAPPDPSISVLDAICRMILAHDKGDRRGVEHFRDELSRDFGWVVRPPASPPDWRRP
jgi:hypothetical protein